MAGEQTYGQKKQNWELQEQNQEEQNWEAEQLSWTARQNWEEHNWLQSQDTKAPLMKMNQRQKMPQMLWSVKETEKKHQMKIETESPCDTNSQELAAGPTPAIRVAAMYLISIEKWPEKGNYEHYSAISLRFNANIHELPSELECRGLHTLVLNCNNSSPTDFPNNFFNGMENNLKVLDLSQMHIKSLPSSLPTLVKLRMLCLNGFGLMTNMALLGSLRNLEILRLRNVKKDLFHDEDGTGFSKLLFLKSQPQIPPGFSCNLCELHVKNCQFKFLFTHSIARGLERLQHLKIVDCMDMEEIIRNERQGYEEEIIFHHLKKMVLHDLHSLRSFYSSMKKTSTIEANNSNPSRPLCCAKVFFFFFFYQQRKRKLLLIKRASTSTKIHQ
ncbi:hypothetical protein HYC85_014213 [Camellia sinensis]|uniref:Disease resistance protein At4g27190-like leucine-rich repeats domain-containing protein n=1 Tax=Camellia sinensis TaxID=4442 RepID=A0A7J7H940_CAMSI|nr:hypothetical protein HYC85_014213 [Camellia sinensis]